jgi:hypothetical protein
MREDPIVAEVHRTREKLAAKFNFDVKAIFADIRKRQTALGTRLVSPNQRASGKNAIARDSAPAHPAS